MTVRILDLFCGGGGSSHGAALAGVEVGCGIDSDPFAAKVYDDNFPGRAVNAWLSPDFSPKEIDHYGPFDMILASPECKSHTCARGNRPRSESSRRTALLAFDYLKHFRPRWAIFENVVLMKKWDVYDEFLKELREGLGYNIREEILDAVDFGVPQTRKRLFILCDREAPPRHITGIGCIPIPAKEILDPPGTWPAGEVSPDRLAPATIERVGRGVEGVGYGNAFLTVYYGNDSSGGWQPLSRPLRTVTTLDRFGLVDYENGKQTLRMLQVPELRRAMGFNEDFVLKGGARRDRIRVLGNGVCPPVMEKIIQTMLSDH
jgi:DNA (cytosine-5)-methyltransferase 1